MKVKCVGCERKFDVYPENFSNFEVVFCPVCGLDHQVIKRTNRVTVKSTQPPKPAFLKSIAPETTVF